MSEAAFYLCAYEFAIKAVNSPWCRLFDGDDAKVKDCQWSTVSTSHVPVASNASLNSAMGFTFI